MSTIYKFMPILLIGLLRPIDSLATSHQACNPIGDLIQLSHMTGQSIQFFSNQGAPFVERAEINSDSCKQKHFNFSDVNFYKMQQLDASGKKALAIIESAKELSGTYCLIDILSISDLLAQQWRTEADQCLESPRSLTKVISLNGKRWFYVTQQTLVFLSSRYPASVKAQLKRKAH